MVKNNLFERAIATVSPKWAVERRRSAAMLEIMDIHRDFEEKYQKNIRELERIYSGASYGALTEDWRSNALSATAEVSFNIVTLRNRMRELVRNDGYAFSAVHSLANNIVGKGIRPSFSGSKNDKQKEIERAFLDWCDSTDCDFTGDHNLYGLEQLVAKSAPESGEVLIVRRYIGRGKNMRLALQILEVDFIVHWFTMMGLEGFPQGTYCINGVYYDKNDAVIGYELFEEHPGDSLKTRAYKHNFVSVDNCVRVYREDRPGQKRGVPVAASVMLEHKMLNQYELAQSHRQTIAASFAVFIKTMNSAEFGQPTNAPVRAGGPVDYRNFDGERIKPGTIQYLLPGEDLEIATPPPVEGYDEYTRSRLRKMARGWGLSYEVLSGDLSHVNFSSGRMGWLEMQRNIESWQHLVIIPKFLNKVWEWWLELEQLQGRIPSTFETLKVTWTPPRREMIDPVKETKSMIDQIQAGLKTLPDAIRELGGDPEIQMLNIEQSNKRLDELKIVLVSDYRKIQEQKTNPGTPAKDGV